MCDADSTGPCRMDGANDIVCRTTGQACPPDFQFKFADNLSWPQLLPQPPRPRGWRAEKRILDGDAAGSLAFSRQYSPAAPLDEPAQEIPGIRAVASWLAGNQLAIILLHFLEGNGKEHAALRSHATAKD